MPKRSSSRSRRRNNDDNTDGNNDNAAGQNENNAGEGRSVAAHVRERQRAVAEREASRLARPEQRVISKLRHADKKKSAVTSTPFGEVASKFGSDKDKNDDNDDEYEWCGPFSVARQMIAKREEARRKREEQLEENNNNGGGPSHPLDELMEEVNVEAKRRAHPSLSWKAQIPESTPASLYAKRQKRMNYNNNTTRTIPTLFEKCVDFVVANFDYVESLGDVDNDIRVSIAKELVARNKLDSNAFEALIEQGMETLELMDCAGIPQIIMAKTIPKLVRGGLRYLLLHHAGRCFGPETVKALIDSEAKLSALSIGGAYLWKDADAARLIESMDKTLVSVQVSTCPLLGSDFLSSLAKLPNLVELTLEHVELTQVSLMEIGDSHALSNVRRLALRSLGGSLDDDVLLNWLKTTGTNLEALDIAHNLHLTDMSLSAIRKFNYHVKSLILLGVKQFTAAGLETLFTPNLPGMTTQPPKVQLLDLSSLHYEAVTDELIELVTSTYTTTTTTNNNNVNDDNSNEEGDRKVAAVNSKPYQSNNNNYHTHAGRSGGLIHLSMEGSTLVTDSALEHLAASAPLTLQELNINFCPKVTNQGLGYLVSKMGQQLKKISIWGCAQVTDEFLDGHARVGDWKLEIEGAWMKQSGTRSLR